MVRYFRSAPIALAERGSGWEGEEEEWENLPKPRAQIARESQAWPAKPGPAKPG